jgi:hypothetical protein
MPRHGALVLLVMLCAPGCASRPALPHGAGLREFTGSVDVHGMPLTLHFATLTPPAATPAPLVLYASGDGGWFGTATGMFRAIAAGGFPTVGFSSRAFMKIEQAAPGPLTVARIAESYGAVLDAARGALALPSDVPIVLSGWSRGASLAVIAAASGALDQPVAGVVAIGLPRDERLDVEPTDDDDPGDDPPAATHHGHAPAREIEMYPLIARVAPRRRAVVQATHDKYLGAADARALFGPDTDRARFFTIDARNHRFGGAGDTLERALIDAVTWAAQRPS